MALLFFVFSNMKKLTSAVILIAVIAANFTSAFAASGSTSSTVGELAGAADKIGQILSGVSGADSAEKINEIYSLRTDISGLQYFTERSQMTTLLAMYGRVLNAAASESYQPTIAAKKKTAAQKAADKRFDLATSDLKTAISAIKKEQVNVCLTGKAKEKALAEKITALENRNVMQTINVLEAGLWVKSLINKQTSADLAQMRTKITTYTEIPDCSTWVPYPAYKIVAGEDILVTKMRTQYEKSLVSILIQKTAKATTTKAKKLVVANINGIASNFIRTFQYYTKDN